MFVRSSPYPALFAPRQWSARGFRRDGDEHFETCSSLKLELIEPATWPTRARTQTATVHWLEAVYNRQRRHSAIDMQSPVEYEEHYWDRRAAA